jgi:hypothetical protein
VKRAAWVFRHRGGPPNEYGLRRSSLLPRGPVRRHNRLPLSSVWTPMATVPECLRACVVRNILHDTALRSLAHEQATTLLEKNRFLLRRRRRRADFSAGNGAGKGDRLLFRGCPGKVACPLFRLGRKSSHAEACVHGGRSVPGGGIGDGGAGGPGGRAAVRVGVARGEMRQVPAAHSNSGSSPNRLTFLWL